MQLWIVLLYIVQVINVCAQDPEEGGGGGGGEGGGGGGGGEGGGGGAGGGGAEAGAGGGGGGGGGDKPPEVKMEGRKDHKIPDPTLEVEVHPVNVQSTGVMEYQAQDGSFTTMYPMACGSSSEFEHGRARYWDVGITKTYLVGMSLPYLSIDFYVVESVSMTL
ncbi:hypothetical protein Y032_0178g679 [Ancylostoma ceylanicum]|nr:hypothetical protein Y032_0178g679 [Ancylostoma ceylanicum]